MKLTPSHALIAAMALVIALLSWTLVYFARDELKLRSEEQEAGIETATRARVDGGRAVVRVSPEGQAASGIGVQLLAAAESEDTIDAYGTVVNVQPLLESRGRYLAAAAEAQARRATAAAAEAEYTRMETLFRDDRNVSEQALRAAEGRYRSEVAQLAAAEAALAALRDTLRTTWGDVITGWATNPDSRALKALLTRTSHLVQLAFPYEMPHGAARSAITVAPVITRAKGRPARFVSESPQVETTLPGETFFYIVDGSDLRAGARVVAAVSAGRDRQRGVLLPNEALVWHAGKAWVYLKVDAETFARYEASAARETGEGWFSRGQGLEPGREVVVSGAQLLLSEELKFQIRNENED
ncbi:MAG: hypothetical protein ACREUQ_07505 [Burkholderiales bacterium]